MAEEAVRAGIGACALWKVRLREAIRENRMLDLRLMNVREEERCELSGLLDDEAERILHRQFHAAAAQIIEMAISGNREGAIEEMEPGNRFAMSLSALGRALRKPYRVK
jgi:hypothetical protein